MRADASGFGLWERVMAAAIVLELFGEIDIEAHAALGPAVEKLIDREAPQVVIDLRPVTFLDAGGLRLLVAVQAGVAARGGTLRVVRGAPGVMRLFHFAGLASAFALLDRIPPALADGNPTPDPAPPDPPGPTRLSPSRSPEPADACPSVGGGKHGGADWRGVGRPALSRRPRPTATR